MNLKILATLLVIIPGVSFAVERSNSARVGVSRVSQAGLRAPNMAKNISATMSVNANKSNTTNNNDNVADDTGNNNDSGNSDDNNGGAGNGNVGDDSTAGATPAPSGNCRDAYRTCMDEFCLLDESEGYRCACSSNINQSKSLIQEIQKIQEEADKLYTEGVEREQLGAKAKLVFGESEAAKKSSRASGLSFTEWLNSTTGEEEGLDADADIGDGLYSMAAEYCAAELEACGPKAEMEEMLYSRQIVADCKSYSSYLAEQKINANANKRTAEAAVRKARLEMLDTTNKYNRGECLLAYKSCIADKGGCGANFENCLDKDLLSRRANACDNVLDQCMAVKDYVLTDWEAEAEYLLVEAEKYADKYRRQTCLAQIQVCLEDGCSTETNSACLTDVNVAAGVCPIIDECNEIIPGIKTVVNDKLGYLRTQFCQNDVDKCLQDKCGENFTAPECLGKKTSEIVAMCPQNMFPSCKNEAQFDIIVQTTLLQMDYQLLQGCLNYYSEQLGKVCGTDMACLPSDDTVMALNEVPDNEEDFAALRVTVRDNSKVAVDEFFKQFETDVTVAACADATKPSGRNSLNTTVFNTAKLIAEIGAENRAMRELETKIAELSRKEDLEKAEANCYATYKVETPDESEKNYSYIRSVSFEPSLRNCHVCRMQQVCEVGGESKATSALKSAAGGLSGGAAAGTMVNAGWGTAIGGIVGAVGAGILGAASGGREEFCQEIESCEDVNM
ncbi:MAG: hypothetical protein IJX89_01025 [Alphaproteobacteria bacterium]|nr:hypothetical protein [Alphaproteobacteria bacterium]